MSLKQFILIFCWAELRLAVRRISEYLNPVFFFVLVVAFFPIAISTTPSTLQVIAPGVIWVTALLAALLSLERLFFSDYESGLLDQWLLSPYPLTVVIGCKLFVHWLLSAGPLLLVTPLLANWFYLSPTASWILVASLLLGTPVLVLIGAIGSALTIGLGNQGVLLALLVLPFYVPVLIFGTGAVLAASAGLTYSGQLAMLGALFCLTLSLAPLAIGAALKIRV